MATLILRLLADAAIITLCAILIYKIAKNRDR